MWSQVSVIDPFLSHTNSFLPTFSKNMVYMRGASGSIVRDFLPVSPNSVSVRQIRPLLFTSEILNFFFANQSTLCVSD